jgi:iron complex transport system substrate-binding protein
MPPESRRDAPSDRATSRSTPGTGSAPTKLRDWVVDPPVIESEATPSPLRLVSAAPSITETCCALGLRQNLVGRTRFCDYPPTVESLPVIGAASDINAEVLISLKPDLVLVAGTSRGVTDRLEALGVKYESLPDRSLDDLFVTIRRIGEIAGRPRTAEALTAGIREQLAPRAPGKRSPRVLLLAGTLENPPRPPLAAGPGSFYDELLRRADFENIVPSGGSAFGEISLEFVLESDPDVIIELDPYGRTRPGGDDDARAAWARVGPLRAVANRRVYVLKGPQHYLLGPRIGQTYAEILRVLETP